MEASSTMYFIVHKRAAFTNKFNGINMKSAQYIAQVYFSEANYVPFMLVPNELSTAHFYAAQLVERSRGIYQYFLSLFGERRVRYIPHGPFFKTARQYYGKHWDSLVDLKERFDPHNLFPGGRNFFANLKLRPNYSDNQHEGSAQYSEDTHDDSSQYNEEHNQSGQQQQYQKN